MNLDKAGFQYLDHCKNVKNLSKLSILAYQRDLESFLAVAGSKLSVSEVDRELLYAYIEELYKQGKSEATVKRRIAYLKTMFKWLENKGDIDLTPFSKFNLTIRIPRRMPRNLSSSELKKLNQEAINQAGLPGNRYSVKEILYHFSRSNINLLNTLIIIDLLLHTGIRVTELTTIELQDIDLDSRTIKIHGKGQRERKVYIPDAQLKALIEGYLQIRASVNPDHSTLLINSRSTPLSSQSARILIRKLGNKAKLTRRVTPHMYRHSSATQLLEAGVDMRFVQKLLGHESIETTQIYVHVEDHALRENIANAKLRKRITNCAT